MHNFFLKPLYLTILIVALTINPAFSLEIKIGLAISNKEAYITSNKASKLINELNGKIIFDLLPLQEVCVSNLNGFIKIRLKNSTKEESIGVFTGPIKLSPKDKNAFCYFNKKLYRGNIIAIPNNSKDQITVINSIDLEDYLLSVVPSEIPSAWHDEALKAQAVAARSYAIGYLRRRADKGYDLESTVEDQVYYGVSAEKPSTTSAVKQTKGIILVDDENKPIIALYHSSGGGYTDSIENLWDQKPSRFIKPRPDYDDKSPYFTWLRSYNISDASRLLIDYKIGELTNIIPLERSESNRVTWLKLIGTSGEYVLRGEELRKKLKLPSSKFNLALEGGKVSFAGRGFGHGLGLSQWGTKALAENGFSYKLILMHYYSGAMIASINDVSINRI